MAIITVSRGTFAGGEQLAVKLAAALGYRVVSREMLYEAVERAYGFDSEELIELMDRAPTRFDHAGERRRQLFTAVQASLCDLLSEDNAVYHGQAGHLLLPGISHVLRVRLIAPRAKRIQMAISREGLDHFEAARKVDRVDVERARWTQFVFGANWADPALYDLVLNLESISVDEAVEVAAVMARLPAFQVTEESRRRMENLTLASRVRARLLTDPATAQLDLRVEAEGGLVRLGGLLGESELARVSGLVQRVTGVQSVQPLAALGSRTPPR